MAKKDKLQRTQLILHGNLWKAMLMIAIPVMINSFLQTLYNLTDTYWLGRIGTEHLAAINLVSPLQGIIVSFGGGFTVAGAVLLSQFMGAGKTMQARKMAGQIFVAAMAFCALCVSVLEAFTPIIIGWLGADGNVLRYACAYLRVVMLDMPFLFTINLYQAARQSQGDTVSPMLLNLLGIGLNCVLDPLLMVVIPLGAGGAALATLIAKMIPALICLKLLRRPEEIMRLEREHMRPDKGMLMQVARIGLPTALGSSAMQLGFLLMSSSVYAYGVNAIAAYGIGNKCNTLNSLPSNGIAAAVATVVGQNMGAGQPKRAEKGYHIAMVGTAILLMTTGFFFAQKPVAQAVVTVFSSDPAVVGMATQFFSLLALWTWPNAILDCTCALFRGSGHTEVTMLVDASRIWVFRFATLLVCSKLLGMGVESIWYSVVVSNGLSALLVFSLYLTGIWKTNRIKVS